MESVAARDFASRACFRRPLTANVKADWGVGSVGLAVFSWLLVEVSLGWSLVSFVGDGVVDSGMVDFLGCVGCVSGLSSMKPSP